MFKSPELSQPEVIIHMEDVSVCYELSSEPIKSLKEYAIRVLQGKIKKRKVLALSNINLDIYSGETLGIVGKNGVGKSTLLKVISRIIPFQGGRLWIKGNVSPLLEIGAGFHPELTGRENIFLNGTLLGHTKIEIKEMLDEILGFAEIGDFIDAPIRTYSSGMIARLGFAVATAWKPEILILDEVFAVGDIFFRKKCLSRLELFNSLGSTILIVSHDTRLISSICSRVVWLEQGKIRKLGDNADVISAYMA